MNRIKLCLVLHAPIGGGSERFMLHLASKLNREKFDISFILFNTDGEYAYAIPDDIRIVDLQMRLPGPYELTNPIAIFKLARAFKAIKPKVIFSTLGYTNLMTILANMVSFTGSPVIIRATNTLSKILQQDRWFRFKKVAYSLLYPRALLIVAPSRSVLQDLSDFIGLKSNRFYYIPNFVDSDFIDKRLLETWKRERLPTDKPVIVSVGSLTYQKGIDVALRAFSIVHHEIPCYYWILGKGSKETRLKQLAADLGISDSVYFLGFQDNPYLFLKHANVFLLSSRYEGFPNALLEAMYCGLSSVVTAYDTSIKEFIKDGLDGMLVEVDNAQNIAVTLKRLLCDTMLRQQMGARAKEKVAQFSADNIIKQYEELFTRYAQKCT